MQPDDDTKKQDLDFSQLDQEVNQLMQQKPDSSIAHPDTSESNGEPGAEIQDTDTWSAIASQLKSDKVPEVERQEEITQDDVEVKQPVKTAQPQKPRGFAMDFMRPPKGLNRPKPKPAKPAQEVQKDLPSGEDYLISASASPDEDVMDEPEKAISGYGSGGFSAKETKQIEKKLDQAPTISSEKQAFEKEINKFEDSPVDDVPTETEVKLDTKLETEPAISALPANNLVKQSQDDDSNQTGERPSMFDTKEYVQPLKPPIKAKKGSETLWVIILIVLIIILIGIGGGYYLFVLGR